MNLQLVIPAKGATEIAFLLDESGVPNCSPVTTLRLRGAKAWRLMCKWNWV